MVSSAYEVVDTSDEISFSYKGRVLVPIGASQVAQWLRIHLLMQETWVRSLGWEDTLEKEMAIHSLGNSMDKEA